VKAREQRAMPRGRSVSQARAELVERLRSRGEEIEEALLTRTYAIADPAEAADPEYAEGLRAAVAAAHRYALEAISHGEERAPLLPAVLLTQARIAARNRIPLDTVLRRYLAGYTLLEDFLMQEAEDEGLFRGQALQRLFRSLASLFDRLIAAVTEEYERGGSARPLSTEQRRAERVERLLAGELLDASELGYDFGGWSLGAIASGPGAAEGLRNLARVVDCHLLLVRREEDSAWAWLGSRRALDPDGLIEACLSLESRPRAIALGEPGENLAGWRLTHRQAAAALPIAQRGRKPAVRYREVALLASVLQDSLLTESLRNLYLAPLEAETDGGESLRGTLRAYLRAGHNVSSAAAELGIKRHTVARRIRAAEERIGCPIAECMPDLDVALRLEG
jgi:hypothetical protein